LNDDDRIRDAPDEQFGEMTPESLAAYVDLIGPHTIGVLVVQFDPDSRSGWGAQAMARPWLTAAMFARLMREAADRWDPPIPIRFTPETPPCQHGSVVDTADGSYCASCHTRVTWDPPEHTETG
jgi:hypothetical protein